MPSTSFSAVAVKTCRACTAPVDLSSTQLPPSAAGPVASVEAVLERFQIELCSPRACAAVGGAVGRAAGLAQPGCEVEPFHGKAPGREGSAPGFHPLAGPAGGTQRLLSLTVRRMAAFCLRAF